MTRLLCGKWRFVAAFGLGMILLASALRRETTMAAQPPPDSTATVSTHLVEVQTITDDLTYPARMVSKVTASILAASDGVINEIPVRLGDRVNSSRTLMTLSHIDPIYTYAPMKVHSSISGVVSSVDVSEGSQVVRGQKLASVTDPAKLRAMVEVPAEDRLLLKPGSKGEFQFGQGRSLDVTLKAVGPFVNPSTGTVTCEFEVSKINEIANLAAGMVGRVSVHLHRRSAIQVPEFAVVYRHELPFVRILSNGKIHFAPVQLGRRQGDRIEILDGVKPGEVVIERASGVVAEGESVKVDTKSGST